MSTQGKGIYTIADVRSRCRISDEAECWHWRGAFSVNTAKGSRIPVAHFPAINKPATVTRIAVILSGRQPREVVWRKCQSDDCVNPAHLITGTRAQWGHWCERNGSLKGDPIRRAANRRAKLTKGAKLTPELAQWAIESQQCGRDVAHGLMVSATSVSRARLGRTWAPLSSPFSGMFRSLMAASNDTQARKAA